MPSLWNPSGTRCSEQQAGHEQQCRNGDDAAGDERMTHGGSFSDPVETFGVDMPWRNTQRDQSVFHGVHHRVGDADEELPSLIPGWQVPLEEMLINTSGLTCPSRGCLVEGVHEGQVETAGELVQLFAKGNLFPVAVADLGHNRTPVASFGQRAKDAHHRSDTDSARDQPESRSLVQVGAEDTVWPVDVNRRTHIEVGHGRGEVAKRLDADRDHTIGVTV